MAKKPDVAALAAAGPTSAADAADTETRVPVPDAAETPRRGPGRPKGSRNKPKDGVADVVPETTEQDHQRWQEQGKRIAEDIAPALAILSDVVGARDPDWKLSRDEQTRLGEAFGTVAAKWMPAFLGAYREELALLYVVAAIVTPRVLRQVARDAEKRKERVVKVETAGAPGPNPAGGTQ